MLRGPWRTDAVQGEGWRVRAGTLLWLTHPGLLRFMAALGQALPFSLPPGRLAAGVESEQERGRPGPRAFEEGPLQRFQHPPCTIAGSQHGWAWAPGVGSRAPPALLGLRRARLPCPLPVSIQSPIRAPRLRQALL